jgi:hypothetical protein
MSYLNFLLQTLYGFLEHAGDSRKLSNIQTGQGWMGYPVKVDLEPELTCSRNPYYVHNKV